ncbi:hypothetical protein [Sinomonas sp. G460-2]|uniref:hypothetical protein n=1 Tax=Sinomonas sp. G460-2 TaxID=3393464 RepID=UPI0039F135E9
MNPPAPGNEDDSPARKASETDLDHATVRELIVQLALVEDGLRGSEGRDPARAAALARREQSIVAALHRNGLGVRGQGGMGAPPHRQVPEEQDPGPIVA